MIKGVKMLSGEILIGELSDTWVEDGARGISYAAILVPVQQGLSLNKFIPFSKGDTIMLNQNSITCEFELADDLVSSYEDWRKKIKAQEAGIVLSQGIPDELKNQKR